MSKLHAPEVENYILNGNGHTLRAICEAFLANETQERQIDKIIQRLRKAGKITKSRVGRDQVWTATPSQAASQAA